MFSCWLLVGQRFLVGMGSGRKRLNILGAYCPDDHEYLDLRLTRDNINGEQFVNLLRLLRAAHPGVERFVLYVDGARYFTAPVVKAWLRRPPEFHLEPLPKYSPNLNLIERLWKFLRKRALSRWHKTFEAMQALLPGKGKAGVKPNPNELAEMWRAAASLERIDGKAKEALGDALLKPLKRSPTPTYGFWSLTRLGARALIYGPLNVVVHPQTAERWLDAILGFEAGNPSERLGVIVLSRSRSS